MHKKSKESAEGAQYESQGQSASEAERVAPGYIIKFRVALKGRNTGDISALGAFTSRPLSQPRGDATWTISNECQNVSETVPVN